MTIGRVAELAWAMGRVPSFAAPKKTAVLNSNLPPVSTILADSIVTRIAAGPASVVAANNNMLPVAGVMTN